MEEIPSVISLEIIHFLKSKDIENFKNCNKEINNFIEKNNNYIFKKLLKNLKYRIYETKKSINFNKENNTFSITKSNNIKTLADAIRIFNLNDI